MTHAAPLSGDAVPRADAATTPRIFYPGVQGLRGVAAVSVLGVHSFLMAEHAGFLPDGLPGPLSAAVAALGRGVELFFIISGFVIPASLDRHGDLRRFFLDRVLRIMPLYVVIHVLVFAVGPVIGYKWLRGIGLSEYVELFLGNLFFLAPLLGQPLAQQNSWSLTYEWIFYGAVACAWAATRAPGRRVLLPIVGICAAAVCAVWPVCTFFLLGMGFARLRRVPVVPRGVELLLLPSAVIWFYGAAQYLHPFAALPPGAVIFALVLAPGSLTSAVLRGPFWQSLGRISYSLYLVHPIALFPFQLAGGRLAAWGFDRGVLFAAFLAFAPVAAFALAVLSHRVIEVRARDWLAAKLGRGRVAGLRGGPVETVR